MKTPVEGGFSNAPPLRTRLISLGFAVRFMVWYVQAGEAAVSAFTAQIWLACLQLIENKIYA
jgi:hypothetical protein